LGVPVTPLGGATIAFVFGCAVGSFLNVCIFRLPRNCLSIRRPTFSFCPSCRTTLAPYDNIPVLSWLVLRGRCRHCAARISLRYPVVEAATGGLFALLYLRFAAGEGSLAVFAVYCGFACALLVATCVDLDFLIIPDEISLGGLAAAVLASVLLPGLHDAAGEPLTGLLRSVVGAAVGAGLTYGMGLAGRAIFRKEAMGLGDVKLMGMVGALLGWRVAVAAFFIAPLFGLVMGLVTLIRTGKHIIPYGPFLSIGALVALLFKQRVCVYVETYEQAARCLFHFFRRVFG
jgi:leader peptidase (prepilin peptidase)/N-methyltransferase